MPSLFRRWFNRPRARWALAALLSLTLVAAQALAARHELSHLFDGAAVGELSAAATGSVDATGHPASVQASHECPLCLLAAALGGAALGPQGLTFSGVEFSSPEPRTPERAWVPAPLRAYASRAPPLA